MLWGWKAKNRHQFKSLVCGGWICILDQTTTWLCYGNAFHEPFAYPRNAKLNSFKVLLLMCCHDFGIFGKYEMRFVVAHQCVRMDVSECGCGGSRHRQQEPFVSNEDIHVLCKLPDACLDAQNPELLMQCIHWEFNLYHVKATYIKPSQHR